MAGGGDGNARNNTIPTAGRGHPAGICMADPGCDPVLRRYLANLDEASCATPGCIRNGRNVAMNRHGNTEISQTAEISRDSAEALSGFRRPLIHYLVSNLESRDKWVRYLSAELLGSVRDPAAAGHLIPLLADSDGDIRAIAATALDALGHSHPQGVARIQKEGCDTCLLRMIAEEALAARARS